MDFITDLPKTRNGHSSILVVIDCFTKMVKLFLLSKNTMALVIALIMLKSSSSMWLDIMGYFNLSYLIEIQDSRHVSGENCFKQWAQK